MRIFRMKRDFTPSSSSRCCCSTCCCTCNRSKAKGCAQGRRRETRFVTQHGTSRRHHQGATGLLERGRHLEEVCLKLLVWVNRFNWLISYGVRLYKRKLLLRYERGLKIHSSTFESYFFYRLFVLFVRTVGVLSVFFFTVAISLSFSLGANSRWLHHR